eukprot:4328178-Pleurochrysis_carterae.AAC.2
MHGFGCRPVAAAAPVVAARIAGLASCRADLGPSALCVFEPEISARCASLAAEIPARTAAHGCVARCAAACRRGTRQPTETGDMREADDEVSVVHGDAAQLAPRGGVAHADASGDMQDAALAVVAEEDGCA